MIPTVGRYGATLLAEIDQVPRSSVPLGAASAIEDNGQMADLEICDNVPMGMAVEIEPDAGMALEELLEGGAPS